MPGVHQGAGHVPFPPRRLTPVLFPSLRVDIASTPETRMSVAQCLLAGVRSVHAEWNGDSVLEDESL